MSGRIVTAEDGVSLHVRIDGPAGPGTPLLLLNSLGTDLSLWDAQTPVWARDRTVVRFDQRGHGASGVGAGPYSLAQLGRDALAVLDALDIAEVDLCGLSLGGLVALWLASQHPERVRRAVFADTAARIGSSTAWLARAAAVEAGGTEAVAELVLMRFFSPAFLASLPPAVTAVRDSLTGMSAAGYAASCAALAEADLTADLGAIVAPSLVIVGSEDQATPTTDAEILHARIPHTSLVTLQGAGHLVNLERPEKFATLVTAWLGAEHPG